MAKSDPDKPRDSTADVTAVTDRWMKKNVQKGKGTATLIARLEKTSDEGGKLTAVPTVVSTVLAPVP